MDAVLKTYLEYICGKENVECDVSISTKTTLRVGGPAKFFVIVAGKEILIRLISALDYIDTPYYIIGNGSNILAHDKGFDGVLIKLGFNEIVHNGSFIYADAGVSLAKVAKFARTNNLSGLEWTSGIPATVGGAVYMNAGAHGSNIADVVVCVDILKNGEIVNLDSEKLGFCYRKSIFHKKKDWIILGAYFFLKSGDGLDIYKKELEYRERRILSQPWEPNAGSTFKRPREDFYVGSAIEELGLKGKRVGGAEVSTKHAGFIINKGNAKYSDVMKLVRMIKKEIKERHEINLKLEYEILK